MKSKARAGSGHARNRPPRQHARLAVVLLSLLALAAACGGQGGSAMPGYVNGTPGSTLAFAQCMRAHGVPGFPDPANGQLSLAGINQNSAQFRHAAGVCGATGPGTGSGQQAQGLAKGLAFSRCMRAHGVRNYPDPTASNGSISVHVQSGSGVDPRSPTFQAAVRACRAVLPNGGDSPGSGSNGSAP